MIQGQAFKGTKNVSHIHAGLRSSNELFMQERKKYTNFGILEKHGFAFRGA